MKKWRNVPIDIISLEKTEICGLFSYYFSKFNVKGESEIRFILLLFIDIFSSLNSETKSLFLSINLYKHTKLLTNINKTSKFTYILKKITYKLNLF